MKDQVNEAVAWLYTYPHDGESDHCLSASRFLPSWVAAKGATEQPLYTNPARGVVDEAMVERAHFAFINYDGDVKNSLRAALQAAQPVAPAFDMLAHLQRQREWSGRTFGPGPRTAGVIDHIRKELREIEADPTDLSEWIDVTILALDGAWRAGGTPEQIIATLVAKQTKNESRTWPDWRTADPDKAIEHDRAQDAQPAVPSVPEWTAVLDALDAVNEAANEARHRGEYGKANKLVNARVTLYRAALANEEAATPKDQPAQGVDGGS